MPRPASDRRKAGRLGLAAGRDRWVLLRPAGHAGGADTHRRLLSGPYGAAGPDRGARRFRRRDRRNAARVSWRARDGPDPGAWISRQARDANPRACSRDTVPGIRTRSQPSGDNRLDAADSSALGPQATVSGRGDWHPQARIAGRALANTRRARRRAGRLRPRAVRSRRRLSRRLDCLRRSHPLCDGQPVPDAADGGCARRRHLRYVHAVPERYGDLPRCTPSTSRSWRASSSVAARRTRSSSTHAMAPGYSSRRPPASAARTSSTSSKPQLA